MAYLREWSPWEAPTPGPDEAAEPIEALAAESAPPAPPVVLVPPAPPIKAPDAVRPAVAQDGDPVPPAAPVPDRAARYRRRGWRIAGVVAGLIVATAVTMFRQGPAAPEFEESTRVDSPPVTVDAPELWLFAGQGWFYRGSERAEMVNADNSCSLRLITLPAVSVDEDSPDAATTAAVVAQYTTDPALVTPQEAVTIAGRSFATTRIDAVTLSGDDSASVVIAMVRAVSGELPMVVALACPPEALVGEVPALHDALQNVWIR